MLWHHWHLFLLSVLLGRHPCSVHLSAADAQRRSRGEKRAPQTRLPLPEWYGRAVRPPPHRGARWLVLTRRMRGGRPAAAGGAAGPAGPAGSGPPQAGRAGPGRAGRSWGTGQGSPGAGKGRLVIAGSAVGEERGLCVGVGPQVCVRGSAAAGAGAGYGGVGAVSVRRRRSCRGPAGAPACGSGGWSGPGRAVGLVCFALVSPGEMRAGAAGTWSRSCRVWWRGAGEGPPGHLPARSGEPRAGPSVPYRVHRGQRWWHWLPATAGRGLLAGRSVLGDLCGLFSCVHRTLNAPRC